MTVIAITAGLLLANRPVDDTATGEQSVSLRLK